MNMHSPLEIVQRGDRTDLSGNRMTSYGFNMGGSCVNYWNGKWGGGAGLQAPIAYEDLAISLKRPDGARLYSQLNTIRWRPDRLTMWHSTCGPADVLEDKTICDDVFVDRVVFAYSNNYSKQPQPIDLTMCVEGDTRAPAEARAVDGRFHIHETNSGIHRVIGLAAGHDFKEAEIKGNRYSASLPIHFEGRGIDIEHEEYETVYVILSAGDSYEEALEKFERFAADPEQALERRTAEWEGYYRDSVPKFDCSSPIMRKLFYHCFHVPFSNLYDFNGRGFYQFPFSSLSKFRLLPSWYWDTAFHSTYEKWLNGSPLPQSTIRNLLLYENVEEMKGKVQKVGIMLPGEKEFRTPSDGQLPFTLCIDSFIFGKLVDPHIIPVAMWDIYLRHGDQSFLEELLPPLIKYDGYIADQRDKNKADLMNIIHQGESGWDNSKRWMQNSIFKYPACPVWNEGVTMQAPDFNAYFYLSRLFVAKLAAMTGDEATAQEFRAKAARTKAAIQSLWDDEIGLYEDRFEDTGKMSKVKTPGGIMPMIAKIPDEEQAKRLVDHLTNPKEFWSKHPAPTLSMDDPDFRIEDEYQSYWNGRVWPNMNWVLIEGLCRYGYWDVARQLALKTAEMAVASGEPTCRENYHPFGEGHHRKFGHNIFNYGWGGISADIILRRLMGIQPRAADDTLCLDPLFPQEWTHGAVDDIHVSVHKVAWEIQRSNGKLSGQLIHSGARPLKVVTALGEFTADNNELQIPLDDGKHLKEHWLDWLES